MARALRIEYPGATYHVMCRGNGGSDIFLDDKDRTRFLDTLAEACERTGWVIHAYVLMPNHYHMLLETPEANLVSGMKWFQQTYTQRFNGRHKRWGHVYQGRYKALIMDPEEPDYFNRVSTYIHLNPVRAGLCCKDGLHLERYRWSSYPSYLKSRRKRPSYLEVERVLESFHVRRDDKRGRERYRDHMKERIRVELDPKKRKELAFDRKAIRRGWCLGDEGFRKQLLKLADPKGAAVTELRGQMRREHGEEEAERGIELGLKAFELKATMLAEMKKNAKEKQIMAWWVRKHTVARVGWISEQLHMGHPMNVTRAVQEIAVSKDKRVKQLKQKMLKCVS